MEPAEECEVLFQVVITRRDNEYVDEIINLGQIYYDFLYNVEEPPIRISIYANKVIAYVKCCIFAQVSDTSDMCISLRSLEKLKIHCVNSKIKILKKKLINTITGKKLLIIWKNEYLICYCRYFMNCYFKVCNEEYTDYFSYLLDVPQSAEESDFESLKIIEEN